MEEEVLVLSAQKYEFENDDKEVIKGISVYIIPVNVEKRDFLNGLKPIKYSLSSEKMNMFDDVQLPAYANMKFKLDFSRNKIVPDVFQIVEEFEIGLING